jgi:hypothetical protein
METYKDLEKDRWNKIAKECPWRIFYDGWVLSPESAGIFCRVGYEKCNMNNCAIWFFMKKAGVY